MKITVDTTRCCSSGVCALTAPGVFDQTDDDGTVVLLEAEPPRTHQAAVLDAAELCPSRAITVTADGQGEAVMRPGEEAR